MKTFKLAFKIWFYITGVMSLVIFADYILFLDFMMYNNYFWYMKEIFVFLFVFTILISFFIVNYFFDLFKITVPSKNKFIRYLKVYFGILIRALVVLIPIIAFIAIKFHGSIESRIWTIIIEILAGFPAIWWFLNKKNLKIQTA